MNALLNILWSVHRWPVKSVIAEDFNRMVADDLNADDIFRIVARERPAVQSDPVNGSGAFVPHKDDARKGKMVPHFSTTKATGGWDSTRTHLQVDGGNADAWVYNPTPYDKCFSIEMEGTSMMPVFADGQRFIAAQDAEPYDGCYCVCYVKADGDKALVRKIEFPDDDTVRLVPENRKVDENVPRIYQRDDVHLVRLVAKWEPL